MFLSLRLRYQKISHPQEVFIRERVHTFSRVGDSYISQSVNTHYVVGVRDKPISTAPAVDPAMIDRRALGRSFFTSAIVCGGEGELRKSLFQG